MKVRDEVGYALLLANGAVVGEETVTGECSCLSVVRSLLIVVFNHVVGGSKEASHVQHSTMLCC